MCIDRLSPILNLFVPRVENPVVAGRVETLVAVGGGLQVQLWAAITTLAVLFAVVGLAVNRAGHGAAARADLAVLALPVKREPQPVASG
jgi:hypothetical protein